jgi:hypothetical protein
MTAMKRWMLLGVLAPAMMASGSERSLNERMPGGALLYVEWAGADAISDARKGTPLGKWLDDPGVSQLIDTAWSSAKEMIRQEAAAEGEEAIADALFEILGTLWHRPVALDVTGVAFSEEGPIVEASAVVHVGVMEEAVAFLTTVEVLLDQAPEFRERSAEEIRGYTLKRIDTPAGSIRYGRVEGKVVVTLGEEAFGKLLTALEGGETVVAQDERFKRAMAKVGTKDRTTTAIVHLDTQAILATAREIWAAMTEEATFPPMVEGGLEAASLTRLRSVTGVWQIADGGFRQTIYMALPAENGRPKWMRQAAVTDEDLAIVPEDVSFASVGNLNLVDLYDGIVHVAQGIGPMAEGPLSGGVAMVEGLMGMKLRDDVLARFGDTWTLYNRPDDGGVLITGAVLMVESPDPAGLVAMLEQAISAAAGQFLGEAATLSTMTHTRHSIRYFSVSGFPLPVAPSWAAHEGRVVIALYPQVAALALDRLDGSHERSLLTNPDFARARELMPKDCSAVSYADVKAFMKWVYKALLPAGTAGAGWARGQGIEVDAGMIPTSSTFIDPLYGMIKVTSSDPDGLIVASHGPLPVSSAAIGANVVSILMPSLAKARLEAKKAVSLSNVRAIVMACKMHAADNDDDYPPDLDTLINEGFIIEKTLQSPLSEDGVRSYLYIAGCDSTCPGSTVLVYEDPRLTDGEGSAMGFVDGHVEWVESWRVEALIRDSRAAAQNASDARAGDDGAP